jgi:hypothetical protein
MKVNGTLSDFAAVRTAGTQIVISYGLKQVEGDLYEWHEVSLNKTSTNALTLDIVKTAILNDINKRTDEKILSGLVWKGNPVWLSQENQFNFKAAYDLAVQTQGATLPVTFKLGEAEDCTPVYHTFETMEDSTDFDTSAVNHIHQSVADGWLEKDGIDWSPYEQYFNE